MITIKALIWKRYIEMKRSKKLLIFLILPIIAFFIFHFFKMPTDKIYFYFGLVMTSIGFFLHWNPENIVYSGYLLVTPLTSRKSWIQNALIVTLSGYTYSYTVMIILSSIMNLIFKSNYINFNLIFLGIVNLPLAFALILSNTLCNVDYSLFKQYLQMPFTLACIVLIALMFFYPKILPVGLNWTVLSLILATLLIIIMCLVINRRENSEALFINTKKLVDSLGNVIDD